MRYDQKIMNHWLRSAVELEQIFVLSMMEYFPFGFELLRKNLFNYLDKIDYFYNFMNQQDVVNRLYIL